MKFKADEIASVLSEEIARFGQEMDVARIGRVLEVGDGIAQIYGLGDAMAGEMLSFDRGGMGQVFNLEDNSIGAVIYTHTDEIRSGDSVRATGRLLDIPVGEAMLGRVINPLGEPLDGAGPIHTDARRPLEVPAPGIADRQPVDEPLQTGIKAIDAMTPIGRGQRELIIGDRKTGKTAIAIDTVINQKDRDVLCVYVAIGQKESTVAGVVESLRAHDAMDHTIVVSASSSDAAPLQYIAPYAGCTLAEHFMQQGRATLVVYDDLSKQAQAYRQISLLLRRPPGREAYPGDVFYLHSRLLERACKLTERYVLAPADAGPCVEPAQAVTDDVYLGPVGQASAQADLAARDDRAGLAVLPLAGGGGSMTALPICETQEGEVSAYIPTNLISITDGQIYLEPSLFFAGIRPAINAGISVSRVGYKAAIPAMKTIASSLRLDLAAYRELESFSQLGMELDPASQRQLDRGQRMMRLLTQPQFSPMETIEQVLAILAGTSGEMDDLDIELVGEFAQAWIEYVRAEHGELYAELKQDLAMPADRRKRLEFIAHEFKQDAWEEHLREKRRNARRNPDEDEPGTDEPVRPLPAL